MTVDPFGIHFVDPALDHRGHGRGLRPADGIVRLSDCADDAAALLRELRIDRAVVAGYSMGGPVAQLLWQRRYAVDTPDSDDVLLIRTPEGDLDRRKEMYVYV